MNMGLVVEITRWGGGFGIGYVECCEIWGGFIKGWLNLVTF